MCRVAIGHHLLASMVSEAKGEALRIIVAYSHADGSTMYAATAQQPG